MRTCTTAVTASVLALGCGGGGGGEAPVTVPFSAKVGGEDFGCGQTYSGLGASGSDFTASDLRMYVHDVRLVSDDGEEVPVVLEDDGKWQREAVALLDFETGLADGCENGTPDTNMRVGGTVPEGTYTGLRFTLGVPFEMNHADAAVAESPMNLTTMFWNWNAGYKFLRIDGDTSGLDGWRFHIGSTGCDGDMMGNVTECANPNRTEVAFDGLSIEVDGSEGASTPVVVADVAELLAGADLESNVVDTPPGCMSGGADDDCAPFYDNLGLPWDGSSGGEQRFFRME